MKTRPFAMLLCLSLIVSTGLAQQKPAKPAQTPSLSEVKKKDEAPAENKIAILRQRALGLIRSAGEEPASPDNRPTAARLQAPPAHALWERDPQRARKL